MNGQFQFSVIFLAFGICIIFSRFGNVYANQSGNVSRVERTTSQIFVDLLTDYDKRIRPYFAEGRPVNVNVDLFLASLDAVDERHMDFSVTVVLHQCWHDPRLVYNESFDLPPTSYFADSIWNPDVIIGNAKVSRQYDAGGDKKFITIESSGHVILTERLLLTLSCTMNFHRFPMDFQRCGMDIESFESTTDDLVLHWHESPAEFNAGHLKVPQLVLLGLDFNDCSRVIKTKMYSCLRAEFLITRTIGYYMLQAFLPSIALVVVSWVSFWIDIRAAPARIGLGITTVLTMISKTNGVRADIPHVSYLKAIDVWFASCLMFVIAALLEYAVVHHLWIRTEHRKLKTEQREPRKECMTITMDMSGLKNRQNDDADRLRDEQTDAIPLKETATPLGDTMRIIGCCQAKNADAACNSCQAKFIDGVCKWLFPFLFLVFNIAYWVYYLKPADIPDFSPST